MALVLSARCAIINTTSTISCDTSTIPRIQLRPKTSPRRFGGSAGGAFLVDRRQMTRYDFGAIAEVVDLDSRDDMIVVTRDLSLSGCFVKTRTPFPAGTEVRVRITYAGTDFAAIGSVTPNITREGMGIEFVEVEPEDQAIVERWLGISARGANGQNGIRLKNRLSRQEPPRVVSVDRDAKADPLTLADNEIPDSPRNVVNFRNDRPQ